MPHKLASQLAHSYTAKNIIVTIILLTQKINKGLARDSKYDCLRPYRNQR
jgi:hypothetical protein